MPRASLLVQYGLYAPNANRHLPLLGDDPTRPNEYYFRYVDAIIRLAAEKGLCIGLLPTWGDKVNGELWGTGSAIFNDENAWIFGQFLGNRYRNDANILWILGGDRPTPGYESVWTAMAEGIAARMGKRPFRTYHPHGGASSSAQLHAADWLDMNMLQSGHVLQDVPIKNLMLSRPASTRIPDQTMLPALPEIPPPDNSQHFHPLRVAYACATGCQNGTYAMVYFPEAEKSLEVDLSCLVGRVKAWWYDPRNGKAHPVGTFGPEPTMFTSPIAGPDWVLVLDDDTQAFLSPWGDLGAIWEDNGRFA